VCRRLERGKELGAPLVEIVVDALVVVAVAAADDCSRAQRLHALLDALADGVEVLILLVAQAEDTIGHVLGLRGRGARGLESVGGSRVRCGCKAGYLSPAAAAAMPAYLRCAACWLA
jgi:hypothetical protein